MPRLADVVQVLQLYRSRYEFLDAFADDIEELAAQGLAIKGWKVTSDPRPVVETWVAGEWLSIEIFDDRGVARFRLLGATAVPPAGESVALGAALGGALGVALAAASDQKEGLLGGLVLGMLVGGLIGAAAPIMRRSIALRFDPQSSNWRLYDGPLLTWAKRTLIPAESV